MAAFTGMQTNYNEYEEEDDSVSLLRDEFLHSVARRDIRRQKPSDDKANGEFMKYYILSFRILNGICENIVSHPLTVLRRQCQVHQKAHRYHLFPFTLIPIIVKIQGRQGLGTLWKGIGSIFIVRGLTIISEDALSKITLWPKEITSNSSLKKIWQHIFLKFITFIIITPFYSASLVETVQSDIASEKPGVLDCVIEGVRRITPTKHSSTCRIMPVWSLCLPTAAHGILRYIIAAVVQRFAIQLLKDGRHRTGQETGLQSSESAYPETFAGFIGILVSDVILYPMETVMHRLHVQGTRTIIDNLDTGQEVMPVVTKYEGPTDCFQSIVAEEGASGLFKGFGALMIQYAIHAAILKLAKFLISEFDRNYGKKQTHWH